MLIFGQGTTKSSDCAYVQEHHRFGRAWYYESVEMDRRSTWLPFGGRVMRFEPVVAVTYNVPACQHSHMRK